MANLISMGEFMAAKKLSENIAKIAAEFIDENRHTLKERGRKTVFYDRKRDLWIHPGDPEHGNIWQQHEAALLLETAHLIEAMKGASFSAWCAAMRIVEVRLGTKLPLRPGDFDPDTGEV
jgi:hypothetical protein